MEIKIIHEIATVYDFLKNKNRYDYIYQFSNLEHDSWKNVVCYGLFDDNELKELAMVVINYDIPVLLAASFNNHKYNIELIKRIKKYLPSKFYAHIDKITLESVFNENNISDIEEYMNMGLTNYNTSNQEYKKDIERIEFRDIDSIKELLEISYPSAWLDDELVKINENFGVYIDGKLISFAGIHAYSEKHKVSAIAHVTTHPDYRKKGYAQKVVDELCNSLKEKIEFIGLNVKINNFEAISCYKKIGFSEFGRFIACEIENNI